MSNVKNIVNNAAKAFEGKVSLPQVANAEAGDPGVIAKLTQLAKHVDTGQLARAGGQILKSAASKALPLAAAVGAIGAMGYGGYKLYEWYQSRSEVGAREKQLASNALRDRAALILANAVAPEFRASFEPGDLKHLHELAPEANFPDILAEDPTQAKYVDPDAAEKIFAAEAYARELKGVLASASRALGGDAQLISLLRLIDLRIEEPHLYNRAIVEHLRDYNGKMTLPLAAGYIEHREAY